MNSKKNYFNEVQKVKKCLKLSLLHNYAQRKNDIATDISSRVQDIIHISRFLLLPISFLEIVFTQQILFF